MSKILIVEDDEKFNQIVCTFLKKHNYQAEGCLHPVQAFDLLCQKHYDLIISDIMMPQINGIDFAQAVRPTHPFRSYLCLRWMICPPNRKDFGQELTTTW